MKEKNVFDLTLYSDKKEVQWATGYGFHPAVPTCCSQLSQQDIGQHQSFGYTQSKVIHHFN